jgi:hypothetical protein
LHSFRTLLLRHHDLGRDLVRRLDVAQRQLLVHQLMDRLNDKDSMMVRHLCVVGNYLDRLCLLGAQYLVALQNQDALNQDVVLTFQVVHRLYLRDVVVGEVLRYQLKMDYYQDVVDVEPNFHSLRMDYCQDVVSQALPLGYQTYQ